MEKQLKQRHISIHWNDGWTKYVCNGIACTSNFKSPHSGCPLCLALNEVKRLKATVEDKDRSIERILDEMSE